MAKTTNIVPEGWTLREAESLYDRLRTPRVYDRNQVNQSGKYPIIDQSESGCIGYLDEIPDFDCSQDMPLTTFANHTCAVRQMKRPFGVIQNVFPLKAKPDVSQHFLYQIINRAIPQNGYKGHYPELRETQFLTPPLPEQQKIATILSSVDDVIEKTRAQIDKLKDLKTGMMQELLTKGIGHTEFKDSPVGPIPAEWMVVRLGGSLECIDSGWSPSCIEIPPVPGKWGVLKVSSVTRGEFLENESKTLPDELLPRNNAQVHAGDVLLTRANGVAELVGKCVIVRKEPQAKLMMSDKILRLKPSQTLHNEFLLHVFNSQIIRKQIELSWGGSSGQKNIGQSDIKSYLIPLPSVEEQRLIARSITQVERVVFDQNKKLVALMNTKKALMQDLLTGKVRVKLTDKESAAV